jgi:hypothetical protein
MPLSPPPTNLSGFPSRRPAASLRTLYRIFWSRDQVTGAVNSPWRFSTIPDGRNRFDVPSPNGTCYWSDRRYGAWVEVFRGATLVNGSDARARRLWTGHAPALHLADLLSPKAYPFGITAAISTQPDYELPQQWAETLRKHGFAGLAGSCSHDPSSGALNVAVFGKAGTPRSQPHWQTRSNRIEEDLYLLNELVDFDVHIAPVPFEVPTISAP